MKIRQKTIKVLELYIDDFDKLVSYVQKNLDFLKKYYILIHGNICEKSIDYLTNCGLIFEKKLLFENHQNIFRKNSNTSLNNVLKQKEQGRVIYNRPIRSGEEINSNRDVVIFGRVNSASRVFCSQNVEVYGQINGTVICNGDYMIIKEINSGVVMFHEQLLNKKSFNGKIKKISLKNSEINIEEL
jgi:septum site-determining protein MinC